MQFRLSPQQESFRDEVRSFLQSELTAGVRRQFRNPSEYRGWDPGFTAVFRRKLGEQGYIGLAWPKEYGGRGLDPIFEVLFAEEMEYVDAPAFDSSLTYIPSAILAFGSNDQKSRFLPLLARGETTFFLGYSEPEAGSDLANLATVAVEDGDDFIITGQKSYSSNAHLADWGWVAARTDPEAPKHRGISLFIVDLAQPGVHISEHPTMGGWTHHSVYFEQVRVPRTMVVGQVNQGWKVVMGAIDFERASLGCPGLIRRQLDRLLEFARQPQESGRRPIDDPVVADRLAALATEVEAARLTSYWVASLVAAGARPQFETSLATLVKRETARALDVAGLELLGLGGALTHEDPHAPLDGEVELGYRHHTFFQFAAGGFDITRTVIAQRGLGLPR